jgi:hypothetical protein
LAGAFFLPAADALKATMTISAIVRIFLILKQLKVKYFFVSERNVNNAQKFYPEI